MAPNPDSASRPPGFRFSSPDVERYRQGRRRGVARPLFRRWEAIGLLLLVTVGAAFVPGVRGAPAMVTLLWHTVDAGDLRTSFQAMTPALLALFFAWRASGRMIRPFSSFAALMATVTLSAVLVFVAFHLGLHLALRASDAWPWWSPWKATAPGAAVGWAVILLVAAIRFLWGRAADELRSARTALQHPGEGSGSPGDSGSPEEDS